MSASVALARLELRRGWRSLVPVVLLVAAVSAIVLWSAATARRTDTAFDRMLEATAAFHVLVNPNDGAATELTTADLLAVDGVADASRIEAVGAFPADSASLEEAFEVEGTVFATDGGSGYRLARPIMVEGRLPDIAAVDEVFVDVDFADIYDVGAGDVFSTRLLTAANASQLLDLEDWAEGATDAEVGAAFAELFERPDFAPVHDLHVTGVGRWPDNVVVDDGFETPAAMITPALFDEIGRPAFFFGGWHVRLDDPTGIDAFRDEVDAIVPEEIIVYQTMDNVEAKAERATDTPGGVMAIFAVVVLVLGTLLVGQSVQRWMDGRHSHLEILRSLGGSRSTLGGSAAIQIAAASFIGFGVGAVGAIAASPLAPVGPARLVEVDRGVHVDWLVLLIGLVVLTGLVGVVAVAAWLSTRQRSTPTRRSSKKNLSAWLRNLGAPLPIATGVQFAIDPVPGRRSTSRLAIVGVLTGVTLAVAALVFTASIERVASTPRLYGTNWSAIAYLNGELTDEADPEAVYNSAMETLAADPAVRGVSTLLAAEFPVNGVRLPVVAFGDSSLPLERTLAEGRLPAGPDEVALGKSSLERLDVSIGDRVSLASPVGPSEAVVVGRVVLPAVGTYSGSDKTSLGEGALVHQAVIGPGAGSPLIAIDVQPGTDLASLEARLSDSHGRVEPVVEEYGSPTEIASLLALAAFPRWLSIALVVLVAIPVGHSLLVSVPAHRRDLAIMSAMGARPATIRSIGFVQGLAVVVGGVAIGVPLGILLGTWSWSGLAESFGTIPEPVVPVAGVLVLSASVLAVGALVGGAPSWRTKRRAILQTLRPE